MKKLLLILFLGITGCDNLPVRVVRVGAEHLIYIKDSRTNLCYATWDWGYESELITNVPCTSKS